jgi:hypothetical protein
MAKTEGTAPETKTIGGKRYRYFCGFSSKRDAQRQAKVLRSERKSVRVVPAHYISWGKPYTQYEVWVRG